MAQFFVGVYGGTPLEIPMSWDITSYTTSRQLRIKRPTFPELLVNVSAFGTDYVQYVIAEGDLPEPGRYYGFVIGKKGGEQNEEKFYFDVEDIKP